MTAGETRKPSQETARRCPPGRKPRRPGQGLSADAVRAALMDRAEDLFHAAFGPPVRVGAADWRAKENPALAMRMRGRKRGLWMDHSADAGGDLMDLVALVFCDLSSAREDFPRVLDEAARFAGISGEAEPAPLRRKRPDPAQDDAKQRAYQAALLRALLSRARPLMGSRSATYLAARGITVLPPDGLADLPPVPGLPVRSAHLPALVVWARDNNGVVTGGQRILIGPDGSKADVEVKKPSFCTISGCPARFAARRKAVASPGAIQPLVIAEGPETALSVWQATGYECWAVFGVSSWKTAPLPTGRDVILAPDRDARKSPAGRAFRRAVAHHLAQGRTFRIATAPEPAGSKRDLGDTLLRAGPEAVCAAIAAATPPSRDTKRSGRRRNHAGEDKGNPDGPA